jgi:hypothetical protein
VNRVRVLMSEIMVEMLLINIAITTIRHLKYYIF